MFRLVPFTLSILTQWRRKKFPKSGESLVCDSTSRPVKLFSTENAVSSCPWVIRLKQRFIASEEIETNGGSVSKLKLYQLLITSPKSHNNFSLRQYCTGVQTRQEWKRWQTKLHPPVYIYIYIYIYTQGWESQGTSRYDIITTQR